MIDLSTNYMGMTLKNPLVVAACCLTGSVDGVRRCADAGAGAVVLRSLFEEQIRAEASSLSRYADDYSGYGEAFQYLQSYADSFGPRSYLKLVEEARRAVAIPVIASLNCVKGDSWAGYARKLEQAGADAIELNVGIMPTDPAQQCLNIIDEYLNILHQVKQQVQLPVAMKIGPYFTSLAHVAKRLSGSPSEGPDCRTDRRGKDHRPANINRQGADALVLFNRFYRFDIDIDNRCLTHGSPYSSPAEMADMLRWMTLLSGTINCDLAGTTGIHTGRDVIKTLLAGATVTQLCTTLYLNGLEQIGVIEAELRRWMADQGYSSLTSFRGQLSRAVSPAPKDHERLQYVKLVIEQDSQGGTLRTEK